MHGKLLLLLSLMRVQSAGLYDGQAREGAHGASTSDLRLSNSDSANTLTDARVISRINTDGSISLLQGTRLVATIPAPQAAPSSAASGSTVVTPAASAPSYSVQSANYDPATQLLTITDSAGGTFQTKIECSCTHECNCNHSCTQLIEALTGRVNTLENRIVSNASLIDALAGRITTLEGQIHDGGGDEQEFPDTDLRFMQNEGLLIGNLHGEIMPGLMEGIDEVTGENIPDTQTDRTLRTIARESAEPWHISTLQNALDAYFLAQRNKFVVGTNEYNLVSDVAKIWQMQFDKYMIDGMLNILSGEDDFDVRDGVVYYQSSPLNNEDDFDVRDGVVYYQSSPGDPLYNPDEQTLKASIPIINHVSTVVELWDAVIATDAADRFRAIFTGETLDDLSEYISSTVSVNIDNCYNYISNLGLDPAEQYDDNEPAAVSYVGEIPRALAQSNPAMTLVQTITRCAIDIIDLPQESFESGYDNYQTSMHEAVAALSVTDPYKQACTGLMRAVDDAIAARNAGETVISQQIGLDYYRYCAEICKIAANQHPDITYYVFAKTAIQAAFIEHIVARIETLKTEIAAISDNDFNLGNEALGRTLQELRMLMLELALVYSDMVNYDNGNGAMGDLKIVEVEFEDSLSTVLARFYAAYVDAFRDTIGLHIYRSGQTASVLSPIYVNGKRKDANSSNNSFTVPDIGTLSITADDDSTALFDVSMTDDDKVHIVNNMDNKIDILLDDGATWTSIEAGESKDLEFQITNDYQYYLTFTLPNERKCSIEIVNKTAAQFDNPSIDSVLQWLQAAEDVQRVWSYTEQHELDAASYIELIESLKPIFARYEELFTLI